MKIVYSWLAEFIPGLHEHPIGADPVALGDAMSGLGLCCEEIQRVGEGLEGIVVARVLGLGAHPGADRIQLVQVDAGDGEPLQICCGAFNMSVGDMVPLATLGATMPNGLEIARRKLRGEWSNGMLCSAAELGVAGDASGILILGSNLEPGTPIADALGIVPDVVFDLDLTPNRPDALSVMGVARDIAAKLGLEFVVRSPDLRTEGAPAASLCSTTIDDPELCGRFHSYVISNVSKLGGDPTIERRLSLVGMRPINPIVDVSNYVMLETGQPNHTYDLAKVSQGHLGVRRGRAGESITTLDEQTRILSADDGVIVNREDEPVGIAGVMGGASTEIDNTTETVLLELAWWDPASIAKSAKSLRLRSEASHRFERGVDVEIAPYAGLRVAELLGRQGATLHPGVVVAEGNAPKSATVRVRTARVNAVLGAQLTTETILSVLTSIGFATSPPDDDGNFDVEVPSWRPDCTIETDIVEEVARHIGYDSFLPTLPRSKAAGGLTSRQRIVRELRHWASGHGYSEALPMPFLAPGDLEACGVRTDGVRVANPLVSDESVMRTSLLPGLIKTLSYNAAHRMTSLSLFEMGHCFAADPSGGLPLEWEELALVRGGCDAATAVNQLWDLAEQFGVHGLTLNQHSVGGLHPTRSALVQCEGATIGAVGELDPAVAERFGIAERVAVVTMVLGGTQAWHGGTGLVTLARVHPTYTPISRMPTSDMDFAFVVPDGVTAHAVVQTVRSASALVVDAFLFDVFRGTSVGTQQRSLAIRARFQSPDRTLSEADLAGVRQQVIDEVATAHEARLR